MIEESNGYLPKLWEEAGYNEVKELSQSFKPVAVGHVKHLN